MATPSPFLNNNNLFHTKDVETLTSFSNNTVAQNVQCERLDVEQLTSHNSNPALRAAAAAGQTGSLVSITGRNDQTALSITQGNCTVTGVVNVQPRMQNLNVITALANPGGASTTNLTIAQSGSIVLLTDATTSYTINMPSANTVGGGANLGTYYKIVITAATITSLVLAGGDNDDNFMGSVIATLVSGVPNHSANVSAFLFPADNAEEDFTINAAGDGHGIGGQIEVMCVANHADTATTTWQVNGVLNSVAANPTVDGSVFT